MRHTFIHLSGILIAAIISLDAAAQNGLRSAYFLDGALCRHKLNPSFSPDRNYIGIGVGDVGVNIGSNVDASNFVQRNSKGDYTFLGASKFDMETLKDRNKINLGLNMAPLAFGFRTRSGAFHTFELGMRSISNLTAPKDLFKFLNEGDAAAGTLNLRDFDLNTRSFVNLSYGLSKDFSENLRVGGKVKLLLGAAQMDTDLSVFNVAKEDGNWKVNVDGSLEGAFRMVEIPVRDNPEKPEDKDVLDLEHAKFTTHDAGPSGYGLAVDLGVVYKLNDFLTASASLLDFGGIYWRTDYFATAKGSWVTDGKAKLEDILKFKKASSDTESNFRAMPVTFLAGLQATVPSVRVISGGLLFTRVFDGGYSWTEGRVSANLNVSSRFGLSTSYALSSFGSSFGAAMCLRVLGLSMFLAADSVPLAFEEGIIPKGNFNMNLHFGLNICFGRNDS